MRRVTSAPLTLLSLWLLAAMLTFAPGANAQGDHGRASRLGEGICDPLLAGTDGLYGLCVAFCEAQGIASPDDPISESEYQAILDSAPGGRILRSYKERKTEADPAMPCIRIEEPCPCWSSAELAAIDGLGADGTSRSLTCASGIFDSVRETDPVDSSSFVNAFATLSLLGSPVFMCGYEDTQSDTLRMFTGTASAAEPELERSQAQACVTQVRTRCEALDLD